MYVLFEVDNIPRAYVPAGFDMVALPSPFTSHLTICIEGFFFTGDNTRECRVTVYDVAGRAVRHFKESMPAGSTSLSLIWHGDDDRGRSVPCGIYFITVSDQQYRATEKVIKIE